MGHQRLGEIPKSQRWTAVVATVAGGGGFGGASGTAPPVADIAHQTLHAAEGGLDRAIEDAGLRFTFYLLTQIVLAAREPDWRQELAKLGIQLSADSSLFDFTTEVQATIDDYVRRHGSPTGH